MGRSLVMMLLLSLMHASPANISDKAECEKECDKKCPILFRPRPGIMWGPYHNYKAKNECNIRCVQRRKRQAILQEHTRNPDSEYKHPRAIRNVTTSIAKLGQVCMPFMRCQKTLPTNAN
ncbi:unnamed protein product [Dicrocoelium dendriticum]|nr:unnamed protein product [Dicrocoelium dendriticum]